MRGWAVLAVLVLALLPFFRDAARAEEAAGPLISPDEMLAVSQVRPGMKGHGRSVFQGTKIETFNVTVLGVLRKIDFGGDMILVRIDDGPPVTSGSGVSAGMSGSPIYVDGKLIGALAFAWPFAKEPVAGVTPIAQMLENYRPGSAPAPPAAALSGDLRPEGGPLTLDGQLFARATVVPDRGLAPARAGGTLYLAPVATPLMVSGMGRAGLESVRKRFERYGAMVAPGPGAVDLPSAERPKIEPGAAVGVQLLGGDTDATAIGTVTYVKGDHVLGFGHPFFGLGSIDMPMTTAYIHGIISSQEVSFKMGSPVEAVGRVSQDRNWSIGGRMNGLPRTVRAEFAIRDTDRGVKRDYAISAAVHRDLTPALLYSSMLNAVGSVSPPTTGTTRGVVEVWAKGLPPVRRENVFAVGERRSAFEELFGDPFAGMPLAELLQIMQVLESNPFGSVPVERVRVTVDVSETRRTAAIERAYADRKRVKPGETVKIGVVLRPVDAPKETREFEVTIPRNTPGGRLLVGVAGGSTSERVRQMMQITRPPAKSVEQLVAQIADREQNSDLALEVAPPVAGISVSGREFPDLPNVVVEVLTGANASGIRMVRTHTRWTHGTPYVLSGGQILSLQVDADEKDKAGASPLAGGPGGGVGSLLDLFRLGGLGGDSGGDLGEDGLLGDEGESGELARMARILRAAGLPNGGGRPLADLPSEPALPSFEELQRILEGDEDLAQGGEGGDETPQKSGVARGPGVWRARTAAEFRKGRPEGILISSRGELALAPEAAPLLASPDRFFWAQAADPQGNVYVGGWLEGSILRIDPSGKQTVFFEGKDEVAVSAMTCGPDRVLYAAAEPSGTVYRIEPSGNAAPLCRLTGERVWALALVGNTLYAGTGSEGRLYRISPDGKAECVFTAPDRHLFALASDGKETLYLGTYPRGKVFRLRQGKVEPLHELPSAAVTALACDGAGNLYVGTSPKASVVRITPQGDVSTLCTLKEKHLFSLLADVRGNVYAGAGQPARLYRIEPDRTVSTLWESQAAYLLSLSRGSDGGLFATTAGPTQVVRLGGKTGRRGAYTSAVLNAGNLARWGTVRWNGSGGVAVETRSGNTAWPDETWSGWSKPYSRAAGEPIASPPGQYLQYRVTLETGEAAPSPTLRSLELFYRPRNRAPEVSLKNPAPGETLSGTRAIRWTGKDADNDRLAYEVFYQREGSDAWVKIGSRITPAEDEGDEGDEAQARGGLTPRVAATRGRAPAGHLPPTHVFRGKPAATRRAAVSPGPPARRRMQTVLPVPGSAETGEAAQLPLNGDGEDAEAVDTADLLADGPALTWNTKAVQDGRYRLRVTATDRLTSPDEPLAAEAVSEYVLVDNTAPRVQPALARRTGLAPPAEVPARDEGTYIASAEYRVGAGPWVGAAAADGIFDSPEEAIRIDLTALKPGRQTLVLRVRDAAGNEALTEILYVFGPVPAAAEAHPAEIVRPRSPVKPAPRTKPRRPVRRR